MAQCLKHKSSKYGWGEGAKIPTVAIKSSSVGITRIFENFGLWRSYIVEKI
jgi:hypothetical protein